MNSDGQSKLKGVDRVMSAMVSSVVFTLSLGTVNKEENRLRIPSGRRSSMFSAKVARLISRLSADNRASTAFRAWLSLTLPSITLLGLCLDSLPTLLHWDGEWHYTQENILGRNERFSVVSVKRKGSGGFMMKMKKQKARFIFPKVLGEYVI